MAKSSKKSKKSVIQEGKPAAPTSKERNGNGATHLEQPLSTAKSARKDRGTSTRKSTAARKPRAVASRKEARTGEAVVSDDAIRLRAYLISEWRTQNGVPGDSAHDWLEAHRQLLEEAKEKRA